MTTAPSSPLHQPQRPTYRTASTAHSSLSFRSPPSRSSSSTRLHELGWAPPSPAPLSLTLGHHNPSEDRLSRDPTYRSSHGWGKDSQTGRVSKKVNDISSPTKSVKSEGKAKALTFVVGAPSSGSQSDGDDGDHEGNGSEDEFDGHKARELGPDEIIRMQIRQPVQTVDSQDLDALLTQGVSDYAFCFHETPPSPPTSPKGDEATPSGPSRVSLGKGKFSEVLLVRKGDVEYALKHTPLHPHHPLIATRLLREPTILAQLLPHPNLVKVFETIRTPGHFYLVEENLRDSITLESLVAGSEGGIISSEMAWSVLKQLSSVVRSLHEPLRVCHRDIKPENILVRVTPSENPSEPPTLLLKLLDFGLATHYSSSEAKLTTCCGSPAYHSPELWRGLREPSGTVKYWGPEVDIWCVGLTLLRCLTPSKYPLGISHSSIFAMSDKVVDALLAVHDDGLRKVLAGMMQMEGEKRMRAFEGFCQTMTLEEHGRLTPREPMPERKEFKSTTFIPTERAHTLDLPLMAQTSVSIEVDSGAISRSPSRSRPRHRTNSSIGVDLPTSTTSSGPPSPSTPELSPSTNPSPGPQESLPITPRNFSHERLHSLPPIELVLLNPTDEPIRRSTSYIKYALRCAGILYQVRESGSDSGFSRINGSTHGSPVEDDSSFVCYLQCVIKLPNTEHQSKASSALIAALRPAISRAHTTGAPTRSSSTPPLNKRAAQPKKEEVKALSFFLSIRAAHHESALARRRADSQARKGKKRRAGDRIIITLSDERALSVVRAALKIESEATSPVATDTEADSRGRRARAGESSGPLSPNGRPTHSGSREAKSRRSRALEQQGEGLGLSLGPAAKSVANGHHESNGITPAEKKATGHGGGFFDFAFSKFPGLGSRNNSENHVVTLSHPKVEEASPLKPVDENDDRRREEAMGQALGFV